MSKQRKVVAIQECACGNESVGSMWIETGIFNTDTPIREILSWASGLSHSDGGKLIITIPKRGSDE